MSLILVLGVFLSVCGITGAFKVSYANGYSVVVDDISVFEEALENVNEILGEDADRFATTPAYTAVIALDAAVKDVDEVTDGILSHTDGVVKAKGIEVNGELAVVTDFKFVENELLATLEQYAWAIDDVVEFADEVKVKEGFYPADKVKTVEQVREVLEDLTVRTLSTETSKQSIAYKTVKKTSSSLKEGKKVVNTKGVNGLAEVTDKVVYLNGWETERTTINSKTLTAAVDEVVTVGTKITAIKTVIKKASSSESANVQGYIWPISRKNTCVSAYWGDGRGHKGMDMAGPCGTEIYASKAGTVVEATYSSSYGMYVTVDHGNGVKTRYAHCSKLGVSVGQKVTQGQVIALVGNTGRSTGNHLHFEVIKNGDRVNPQNYIGSK